MTAAISAAALCLTSAPFSMGDIVAADENFKVRDPFFNFSSNYNYYESEHFQFIWGNSGADSAKVTQEFLEGNAKNMEDIWDVYMNDLSMAPPSQSVEDHLRDGNEYKTNIYISGTGLEGMVDDWAYMSWDSGGFAYMFCCVDSMQVNPPSWVMPHEFGHVMTAHQKGWNNNKYSYAWWEAIGNWYREQYLYSDYSNDDTGHGTDFFETYMKNLNFTFPGGRDYYASWAFLQYLTENPDNLEGYGADFVKKMLQEGRVDEYPFDQVERLAPADIKETLGMFAAHMAGLDFKKGDAYRARLDELLAQGDWNWQQIYTMPEPVSSDEYVVPTERAPQFAGLNIIPLEVSGGDIEVHFTGLSDLEGADWRACIVQQAEDGSCTYSKLFGNGEYASVPYTGGKAYLSVIATPDLDKITKYGLPGIYDDASMFSESNYPFSEKERYPYAIRLGENVSIAKRIVSTDSANWWEQADYIPHSNGGGLVASTATVEPSVYVAPNAIVKGNAKVTGNVKLLDYAVVEGSAQVADNAVIAGYGMVAENAVVSGNARVDDCASVMGRANISGNAKVIESACVFGNVTMTENSVAKGMAYIMADGKLSGQGIADGDYYDDSGKTLTHGTSYGWTSSQSYADSRPYTDKLIYAYDFDNKCEKTFEDRYTSTYGLTGNILWEAERTSAKGVMTFADDVWIPGSWLQLDKSALMTDNIEIQMGILNRDTSDACQFLLDMSDTEDTTHGAFRVQLENGSISLLLSEGIHYEIIRTPDGVIKPGEWANVRIIIDDGKTSIIVNDQTYAEEPIHIKPVDILDAVDENANLYFGRGTHFTGSLDYLRFYSGKAEKAPEIYTESEDISTDITTTTAPPETTTADTTTTATTTEVDTEVLYGDANCDGKVEIADATLILQFLTNKDEYSMTEQGMRNADVAGGRDGVTANDALVIQQVDAGIYKQEDLPIK